MIPKTLRYIVLFAAGLLTSHLTWADLTRGEMLAHTCAGCHGTNGSSVGPASPSIAAFEVETFVEMMEAFQADDRPGTVMNRIAKGYSEAEITAMAEFFNKQPFIPAQQAFDASQVKQGSKLHKKHCEKCHVEGGSIDEDGSSILAGQWRLYLEFALADFAAGERDMPKKMRKQLEKMHEAHGEDGIDAVLHYYASQQ